MNSYNTLLKYMFLYVYVYMYRCVHICINTNLARTAPRAAASGGGSGSGEPVDFSSGECEAWAGGWYGGKGHCGAGAGACNAWFNSAMKTSFGRARSRWEVGWDGWGAVGCGGVRWWWGWGGMMRGELG